MMRHYQIESADGWLQTFQAPVIPNPTTSPEFANEEVLGTIGMLEDDLRRRRLDPRVVVLRVDQPTEAEIDARLAAAIPRQA